MPNWTTNCLNFTFKNESDYNKFIKDAILKNESGEITSLLNFEKLAPVINPKTKKPDSKYEPNGVDEQVLAWGVKWGESFNEWDITDELKEIKSVLMDNSISAHIVFDTPWDFPHVAIVRIAYKYHCNIDGVYYDEGYNPIGSIDINWDEDKMVQKSYQRINDADYYILDRIVDDFIDSNGSTNKENFFKYFDKPQIEEHQLKNNEALIVSIQQSIALSEYMLKAFPTVVSKELKDSINAWKEYAKSLMK